MYKGCENCKHFDCGEKDFPCCDCKNNFISGTPLHEVHLLLWEPNTEIKDPVNNPSHYTQGDIQCIDAMISAFGKEAVATWCKINAFKYTWREEHKNGMEDIDKAIWYLNKFKELKSVG